MCRCARAPQCSAVALLRPRLPGMHHHCARMSVFDQLHMVHHCIVFCSCVRRTLTAGRQLINQSPLYRQGSTGCSPQLRASGLCLMSSGTCHQTSDKDDALTAMHGPQAAPAGGIPRNRGDGGSESTGALSELRSDAGGDHQPTAIHLLESARQEVRRLPDAYEGLQRHARSCLAVVILPLQCSSRDAKRPEARAYMTASVPMGTSRCINEIVQLTN